MACSTTLVGAPPQVVFSVLADPPSYAKFVVGTKRIRRFDPRWPDPGSTFHHTLGFGPFILRDLTTVAELDEPRVLVLRAQMRPFAVNRVAFRLTPGEEGTEVAVEEHPIERLAAAMWNPALDRLMWLRNQEMLRRLKGLAQRRRARQLEVAAS